MSRIPLTPGCKERISANVGRMLAAWNCGVTNVGHGKDAIAAAVGIALSIEEAVTAALTPEDDDA